MKIIDKLDLDADLVVDGHSYTLEQDAIRAACDMTRDWKESYTLPPGDLCLFIFEMVYYKHRGYISRLQMLELSAKILRMTVSNLEGRLALARTKPVLMAMSVSYRPKRKPLPVKLTLQQDRDRQEAEGRTGLSISPEEYWWSLSKSERKKIKL